MKTVKLLTLLFLSVLFASCGASSIKIVEISTLSLPSSVENSEDHSKYVYYKNELSSDILTLKAICKNSDMKEGGTSPISWTITFDNTPLSIPLYNKKNEPVFIANNNYFNIFLSSIEKLGTYTIKALSENGKFSETKLIVLSPFSLRNSILVSFDNDEQNVLAEKTINLIRGKTYSFSLSNASSFGQVTWSITGGGKNDYFISKITSTKSTRKESVIRKSQITTLNNSVMLNLADDNDTAPLLLTVSTPNEEYSININCTRLKVDNNLPFPTLAPLPIVNGYEVRVYVPDEANNENYELEVSKNNGAVWNAVYVNNDGYYTENIQRVSKFNVDETIYFKARIKNKITNSVGKTTEIKLLLQSFPSTVRFNKTIHDLILPSYNTSDDEWENFHLKHPLFTLNASSDFEEIYNIPLRENLLSNAYFSIYKTLLNKDDTELLLQKPLLNDENNFNNYSINIPFYTSRDNNIFYGNTSFVKGYSPHAIVEEIDSCKVDNIVDISAKVDIVPYVFLDKNKMSAFYQISIPLNKAVLPRKNAWFVAVHYKNLENEKNEFVILRGIDFKNKNGRLVYTISDKNGNPIAIKTNNSNETIRLMILQSDRTSDSVYYSPLSVKFNSSIWWDSTSNAKYNDEHITLLTDDNVQKYTNKRIALITKNDPSFIVEYCVSEENVNDLDVLTWTTLNFGSSKSAEIDLFEKKEADGVLFIKLTSSLDENFYYIIPQSVALTPCRSGEIKNYNHTQTGDYRNLNEDIKATLTSSHPFIKCTYAYCYSQTSSDNGGGSTSWRELSKWIVHNKGEYPLTLYHYASSSGHTDHTSAADYTHYVLQRDFGYLDNKFYFKKNAEIKTSNFTNNVQLPADVNYQNDISPSLWENK